VAEIKSGNKKLEILKRIQSFFSRMNICSTDLPNILAIFNARTVDGTYLHASMELIV
jgi:hypothetical protein